MNKSTHLQCAHVNKSPFQRYAGVYVASISSKNRTGIGRGWKCGRTFRAYLVTKQDVTEYTKVLFYALIVCEVGVNKSDIPIRNKALA